MAQNISQNLIQQMLLISFFLTQNSSKSREKKQREKLFISLIKTVEFEKFFDRVTKTRKQQIKKWRENPNLFYSKKT